VTCVALAPDRLYSGSADCSIRVWDWRKGQCLAELQGHSGTVTCLALDVDGETLLSGSSDCTARLWDTRN